MTYINLKPTSTLSLFRQRISLTLLFPHEADPERMYTNDQDPFSNSILKEVMASELPTGYVQLLYVLTTNLRGLKRRAQGYLSNIAKRRSKC